MFGNQGLGESIPRGSGRLRFHHPGCRRRRHASVFHRHHIKRDSALEEEEEKPTPTGRHISDELTDEEVPTFHSDVIVLPTMLPPPNPLVPTGQQPSPQF